jgi:hypothetical protein
MADNIFEIRSNINSSFDEIERLRIEREEREKKERDEKWRLEQAEREKKVSEWADKHPNMNKYTYATYYNYDNFNFEFGTYCKIHFYEWSDVNREPLIFERFPKLYDFLDRSGLFISEFDNSKVKPFASCYISCMPNSKDLIVCTTYKELKQKMHEAINLINVLKPVPEVKDEKEVKVLSCAFFPPKQITYA